MLRSRTARTLAVGLGASLAAHAAIAGVLALSLDRPRREPEPELLPVELVAPEVPELPVVPEDLPDSAVNAARKEATRPAPERVVVAKPRPPKAKPAPPPAADLAKEQAGELAVARTPDAGVDPQQSGIAQGAETPADTPPAEPAPPTPADVLAEAQVAAQPIDPALVDLRGFAPKDSRLIIVVRPDRMRGTPWATPLDAIMKYLPDYRTVIAGTGMKVADSFETIVIATPDPSEVTQTFVAARTRRTDEALRDALTKTKRGDVRVEWTSVGTAAVGKRLDDRAIDNEDERVFTFPATGWVVLARPSDLPHVFEDKGRRPAWLGRLGAVEAQTGEGDAGPILIMSGVDVDLSEVVIPGLATLPSPRRLTLTVTPHEHGLVFVGAAAFEKEETAAEFHKILVDGRDEALDSIATKFVLGRLHARDAVERMKLGHSGKFVTFSTSIATAEGEAFFKVVASWAKGWFAAAGERKAKEAAP